MILKNPRPRQVTTDSCFVSLDTLNTVTQRLLLLCVLELLFKTLLRSFFFGMPLEELYVFVIVLKDKLSYFKLRL